MQFIKIAWRNLARNKMRTFISILAIAVVVVIVIFSRGFMVGVTETIFSLAINNNSGHARIIDKEYQVKELILPLDYTIDGFENGGAGEMIDIIEKLDSVEYTLPRIRFGAMASINEEFIRMIGVGIDCIAENKHGAIPGDISLGRMPEAENEIVVGSTLLENLGKELNDNITLMFSDAYQSLRGRTFQIVGVRNSNVSELDKNYFYLPLEIAQTMLWLEDELTEIMVFTRNAREANNLKMELDTLLLNNKGDKYSTIVWDKADPYVETFQEADISMNLVYFIFSLMGAVVIVVVLTMIIRERTSEIGMMSALGLKSRDIMKVFVVEGTFMGIIGSLLGVIIGGLVTFYYSKVGIYIEVFADMMQDQVELLMEPVLHIGFSSGNLIVAFTLTVIIVIFTCIFPARQAARLEPIDALHSKDN